MIVLVFAAVLERISRCIAASKFNVLPDSPWLDCDRAERVHVVKAYHSVNDLELYLMCSGIFVVCKVTAFYDFACDCMRACILSYVHSCRQDTNANRNKSSFVSEPNTYHQGIGMQHDMNVETMKMHNCTISLKERYN